MNGSLREGGCLAATLAPPYTRAALVRELSGL
jgi:hypothetical protein